jgi:hypothetical protein
MMCYVSPCFPTPVDAARIIDAGFSDQLMPTAFIDITRDGKQYELIAPKAIDTPAIVNGTRVVLNKCTFLDKHDKCSLHDLGLKPTEGKIARHGALPEETLNLRVAICKTWQL